MRASLLNVRKRVFIMLRKRRRRYFHREEESVTLNFTSGNCDIDKVSIPRRRLANKE